MPTKDELERENELLKAQLAGGTEDVALKAQIDQVLDMLGEQQQTIETLRAAAAQAGGVGAQVVQQDDAQSAMDAELDALKAEFPDYPLIDVFERRVIEGKDASSELRLKDEAPLAEDPRGEKRRWQLRWFNFGKEGRAQQATNEGYVKVRWDDLQDREAVVSDDKSDGYVRKGDKGLEVLHKMPLKLYVYKKRRDAMGRAGLLTSESRLRDHMANSVAAHVGATGGSADQAGSFAHGQIDLTITPGARETMPSA